MARRRRFRPQSSRTSPGRVAAANASRLNSLFDRLPLGSGISIQFPKLRRAVTAHRLRPLHDIEDRRRFDFDDTSPKYTTGIRVKSFVEKQSQLTRYDKRQRLKGRTIRIVDEGHPLAPYGAYYGLSLPELIRSNIGFDNPDRVIICVRRRQRKQVLFATSKAGPGRKRQRRPRRNNFSNVRC